MKEQLLFHWGLEGGGSELYGITEDGKDSYMQRSLYVDKEDIDIWHHKETKYPSFEAFWAEALTIDKWFWWHPVFIHDQCKPIIRKSLEKIDLTGMTQEDHAAIDEWEDMLKDKNQVFPYDIGNEWQINRYRFMSEYNRHKGITEFGKAKRKGKSYSHILKETSKNKLQNFLGEDEILKVVEDRFKEKAGDLHRVRTNTVASQPCCFNLFAPLKNRRELAGKLFSLLMGKAVEVQHIAIEFTPCIEESLGDQSKYGGTDADVAVFYQDDKQKTGVILIEFKYIEADFSVCSSYKEKNGKEKDGIKKSDVRKFCDNPGFYKELILSNVDNKKKPTNPLCGYLKYNNWQLLTKSKVFDLNAIKSADHCPFRYSLQQLWRNILLAENVKEVRGLDEFQFWVLCPSQNKALWKQKGDENVKKELQKILNSDGKNIFFVKDIKMDFVDNLKVMDLEEKELNWIRKFEERYLTNVD
ncbi:MAG: hypothetical protein NTX43_12865 [Bacteroidetes bacterium]|nr:hypothetical protein [Bacteroidota bacterium]